MKHISYIFILVCMLLQVRSLAQSAHPNDSLVLVELNDSLDYYLFPSIKWDYDQPVSGWYGVELTSNGRVTRIPSFGEATRDAEDIDLNILLQLDSLRRLDFANRSTQNFDWSACSKLPLKYLKVNKFDWIENKDKLTAFEELDTFIHTRFRNGDTISFPNEVWRIPQIEVVELSTIFDGVMSEIIDSAVINGSHLRRVLIMNTLIEGRLNPSIGDLSGLEELHISINTNLEGPIPASLGNLANLMGLYLYGNNFEGEIPEAIYDLDKLTVLDLSSNRLEGNISSEITGLENLRGLNIGKNGFVGNITKELAELENLESLSLIENDFEGAIPNQLGCLQNEGLRVVYLSRNRLTGGIPTCLLENKNTQSFRASKLDLSSNFFSETIQGYSQIGWRELDITDNQFTFEDFIHIVDSFECFGCYFEYAPQQVAGKRDTIIAQVNAYAELDLSFDDTVTTNVYYWFKNEMPYDTIYGTNELVFDSVSFSDAGTYHAVIENSVAPELSLMTKPIYLIVDSISVATREEKSERYNIYPNPVKQFLTIEGFKPDKGELSIYNALGQKVLEVKSERLDLSLFSKGSYYIIGHIDQTPIAFKILKL